MTNAQTSGYCSEICAEDVRLGWNSGDGIYATKISGGSIFVSHKSYNCPNLIRIEVTGTSSKTMKYYLDDILLGTATNITRNQLFRLKTYLNRSITIKNLKIKSL